MNRRGFLAGILATGVAPAVVGSGILMPVRRVVTPELYVFEASREIYIGPVGFFFDGVQWPSEVLCDRIRFRKPKLLVNTLRSFKP